MKLTSIVCYRNWIWNIKINSAPCVLFCIYPIGRETIGWPYGILWPLTSLLLICTITNMHQSIHQQWNCARLYCWDIYRHIFPVGRRPSMRDSLVLPTQVKRLKFRVLLFTRTGSWFREPECGRYRSRSIFAFRSRRWIIWRWRDWRFARFLLGWLGWRTFRFA